MRYENTMCVFVSILDQRFVVRKSPALLQEMINVGCQLTMMANSRGGTHAHAQLIIMSFHFE